MEIFIQISQFILSLSLLIVLHEFGHYIPAKIFKIKVEKFYLFFDIKYSIFKKKIGETEWGIGWLPLGGYVKIAGMIDESMDKEQMAKPPQPWEFRSKPSWQRLIVMLGGVFVNFLLALIIYILITFFSGTSKIPMDSLKGGLEINNPAMISAGFKTGDKILKVDGKEITTLRDANKLVITGKDFTILRNDEIKNIILPDNFLCDIIDSKDVSERIPPFGIRSPFVVYELAENSLNKNYDLKKGDIITSVQNQKIDYKEDLINALLLFKNQDINVGILRNESVNLNFLKLTLFNIKLSVDNNGKLGIISKIDSNRDNFANQEEYEKYLNPILKTRSKEYNVELKNDYSLLESVSVGTNRFSSEISDYFDQLSVIFNPSSCGYKAIGGFGTIMSIFPNQWDWIDFWTLTAFLSIMLGVLNLLPIPALDGGHAMFLIYEMISGKKPSDKFLETVQLIGFLILITLVIYANGNDIYRFFFQ